MDSLLQQLGAEIPDLPTLLSLLCAPLDCIGLLPPQYRTHHRIALPAASVVVGRHVPALQRILLTRILPVWHAALADSNAAPLFDQYFCPDSFSNAAPAAAHLAVLAYSAILSSSLPLTAADNYPLRLLVRLAREYPIDRLYAANFAALARSISWEDCLSTLCALPAKVANARHGDLRDFPSLDNASYFHHLAARTELLILDLARRSVADSIPAMAAVLHKFTQLGLFPATPPLAPSRPSFFNATLPAIRSHLDAHPQYSSYWAALFLALPSSLTLQSILTSLFSSLILTSHVSPHHIKHEAALLDALVGNLAPTPEKADLWEIATGLILTRDWPHGDSHARIFVCWISGGTRTSNHLNLKGYVVLNSFLELVLDTWSSPEHIKHSLISQHRYLTSLFLLTTSYFPPSSSYIQSLASSPPFIRAISTYISHPDHAVRRCGMLGAEVIAHLCGQKLDFGGWDGDQLPVVWCRELRTLLIARDVDAKHDDIEIEHENILEQTSRGKTSVIASSGTGYDSDDSITGYDSPPSSRPSSPTPSELAEIEKDPTLNVTSKKIPRPVYLSQIGELFRGGGSKVGPEDPHEADRIEMALNCAEELIRKKRDYGTELAENAVNLVFALLSLQDNFDLDGFSEKRQGALTALVACAPLKSVPALIQEFFKNQYSTDQRFVAMNALAMGARELASLPVPPSLFSSSKTTFPSKMLPAPLHRRYIDQEKHQREIVPLLMDDISRTVLDKTQKDPAIPELALPIVRERRLRVSKKPIIAEISSSSSNLINPYSTIERQFAKPPVTTYIDVAAEYFILPLIHSFWSFLRDENTREERTFHREGRARYRGAGTGLILNPLVLAQLLRTLAILVNAATNAMEFLGVIGPEALELAVVVGTRPVSAIPRDAGEDDDEDDPMKKEATVLTACLELALIVLDCALEVDGGKILSLENTSLLLGVGEWAGRVFADLEKGLRVQGTAGTHEAKLSRAAAGVLLKIDGMTEKWRRSMVNVV